MSEPEIDDVHLLSSALSADMADMNLFIEVLASRLASALPAATSVEYQGGFLSKKKVRKVSVSLGDLRYCVARVGPAIVGERAKVVRGVALKTDELPLAQWVDEFSSAMAAHLQQVSAGREALERMLLN